jgi:UDP-glucose 4-epimerase
VFSKKILVTGGAGYIGSHVVLALVEQGFEPVILDNFSTGHRYATQGYEVIEIDLRDAASLDSALRSKRFDGIMHFAAKSIVSDSMRSPLDYFENNVVGSLNLINAALKGEIEHFVFSSSAAVYGDPVSTPITEAHDLMPINPYGQSKRMIEIMLEEGFGAHKLRSISFRYFNAAGAAVGANIGENHEPETHLIPNVLRSCLSEGSSSRLKVFGNDYETRDGTCVRDYIHVGDLADAHVRGLEYLFDNTIADQINLGTEHGATVLEVIKACEEATERSIDFDIEAKREGDPAVLIADNSKARALLAWEPRAALEDCIRDAWLWHTNSAHYRK